MTKQAITEVEEIKEPEPIISQFGVGEEDGDLYRVERDFFLNVKLGPLAAVKRGQVVRLSEKSAPELFYAAKVSPVELSDVFEALCDFRTTQNGEWLNVQVGDIISLGRDEALKLLREGKVKESKGVL